MMRRQAHECPIPKPPGIIGRIFGFKDEDNGDERLRPRIVTERPSKGREDKS